MLQYKISIEILNFLHRLPPRRLAGFCQGSHQVVGAARIPTYSRRPPLRDQGPQYPRRYLQQERLHHLHHYH